MLGLAMGIKLLGLIKLMEIMQSIWSRGSMNLIA